MLFAAKGVLPRLVAVLSVALLVFQAELVTAVASYAAEMALATKFSHTAPPYVRPAARTLVQAKISDPAGIKLARCYFRSTAEADYVFVPMKPGPAGSFTAELPALTDNAQSLQYRLLAVNSTGQISKTAEYSIPVKPGALPSWQKEPDGKLLHLSSEAEPRDGQDSKQVTGFNDDVTVDVAESSARLMLVSGVGVATGMAATSGSAATAGATAAAGTTAASTTAGSATILGLKATTFWLIAAGVGAVAVGGAVAASSGGGGGGGGGSKTGAVTAHW